MLRLKNLREERGAITISDVLIVLVSAIFIGAVAVPFMLGQQADMNKRAAQLAAHSIAVEVETYLIVHRDDRLPSPVVISHNPGTQRLNIPLASTRGTPEAEIPFTLGNGAALIPADPTDSNLAGANIINSRDSYCIAVTSFGQRAFHSSSGPAESCPEVQPTLPSNEEDGVVEEDEVNDAQ
jgi:type II secretory pathway pseudopilin PulG